jgi:hypothetical protein
LTLESQQKSSEVDLTKNSPQVPLKAAKKELFYYRYVHSDGSTDFERQKEENLLENLRHIHSRFA